MLMYRKLPLLLLFLLTVSLSTVRAQFTLTGEIRPRVEFRNGFKTISRASDDPAAFIEQRSRLYFIYKQDKMKFNLTLQDVRIWGNVSQIFKEDPALSNVYEAWGEYYFNEAFSVKAGRQALNYDNARFLGNLAWAQQARSHDALLFKYEGKSGLKAHLGGAFNQNVPFEPGKLAGTFYSGVNNYKTMQYLWLHKAFDKTAKLSALIFNDGRQTIKNAGTPNADTTMSYRQTYGVLGSAKLGNIKLDGEFYYQGGQNAAGVDVDAFLGSFSATYKTNLTPLTIGLDYVSGTNQNVDGSVSGKDNSFNPLYGTNHKFYGLMDYFYVGNGFSNVGLIDIFFKTKFKLSKKAALIAHYHHFESEATIPGQDANSLGDEIDLVLNLNLAKGANLKIGYSQMFATDAMGVIKGRTANTNDFNNWAWVMLTIKPTLFTTKKKSQ